MSIVIENAPVQRKPGHVPFIRTRRGEDTLRALASNTDPALRTWFLEQYRKTSPAAASMPDEIIINRYVQFLMSCPTKCPHCHPEASS